MSECFNEIIGVQEIILHYNKNVQIIRPNIGIEDEVNIISSGENSYIIYEPAQLPKWIRTSNYSENYKQNYFDEFTFVLHGVRNNIPVYLQDIRSNRHGYLVEVKLTVGDRLLFPTPVFLNSDNTKPIDSISWQVSLSYRVPTFEDKLTLLSKAISVEPIALESSGEIIGLKELAFYINEDVTIRRPNPSIEDEIDLIAHATGSYLISDSKENIKWTRTIDYSDNYKPIFNDEFNFVLHGINNNVPGIIKAMRNNRKGYVTEVITKNSDSFVFPAPVFLNSENTKPIDSHSWQISLSYRVPTFEDKLKKINTVLMTASYITIADNKVLGDETGAALVSR